MTSQVSAQTWRGPKLVRWFLSSGAWQSGQLFKVIFTVATQTLGRFVEPSRTQEHCPKAALLPEPGKLSPSAVVRGTKFTIRSDHHRKRLLPQSESGAHARQPGQRARSGSRGSRQDPISPIWAVSDQQARSVQERPRLGLRDRTAQEVSHKQAPSWTQQRPARTKDGSCADTN